MTDIAATLATDFLAAQGWVCILIRAQAAGDQCIVTVEQGDIEKIAPSERNGIGARGQPGLRIWLKSRKQADKVVAALFSRHQEAHRRPRGDGLVVKADTTTVEQMIRTIADSLGYALVGDDFVDEQMALITRRIPVAN
jgi:hypothetical protein